VRGMREPFVGNLAALEGASQFGVGHIYTIS
jgi:hypothetical protein